MLSAWHSAIRTIVKNEIVNQQNAEGFLKGWFPLGLNCRRSESAARIKLNRETKNFSRFACNLRLMEISLYSVTSNTSGRQRTDGANKGQKTA